MYLKTFLLMLVIAPVFAFSQTRLKVILFDHKDELVGFGQISIQEKINQTNENGLAEFDGLAAGKVWLIAESFGYKKDSIQINLKEGQTKTVRFTLQNPIDEMEELVVTGTLTEISKKDSPVSITVVTPKFFAKNPTPGIFGAIGQVNGIRTQMNCSVCNTGDIHINGMEGAYTMVTIDGMPIVGGLSTVYGLQGIPSNLIERVEIIKGPASTLYGSEAVGGLINVITKSSDQADKFHVGGNFNSYQEANIDLGYTAKFGKNVSTLLGVNYFNYSNPVDNNNDNFTDITLQNRVSIFNKWNFKRKHNRVANLAARYIHEDRWGGEMQWVEEFWGGDSIYGEAIETRRVEVYGNYQLPFKETILFQSSFSNHDQNSTYGDLPYIAQQRIFFNQLFWSKELGIHNTLLGVGHRFTFYDDNTTATSESASVNTPSRTSLPGVFVQDLMKISDQSQLLVGARLDLHPEHGSIFSPRINYKYSPSETFDTRLSLGNGFRVVNLFTEEHAALTGAREVIVQNKLAPEQSYNASLNLTKKMFPTFGIVTLDANLFYTYFTNKINPDYETNDDQIIYQNLNGFAIYRGMNLDARVKFEFPLTINVGFTYLDAFEMNIQSDKTLKREAPLLTEKMSGSITASYSFRKARISIDYTSQMYGSMNLPVLENDFRASESAPFATHNLKVSKKLKDRWVVYCGVKNIFNFTPPANSIMRSFDPFDKQAGDAISNPNGYTFDPSYVYAPNQGVRGYFGLTYTIK